MKLKPTECLGECVHLEGCKSFNVLYNESESLICDLYASSGSMLQKNSLTMHFTVNGQALTQILAELTTDATADSTTLPATNTTKTVSPVEEYIIVKNNSSHRFCVSSTLMWILHNTSSNCQLFHFIDGGALSLLDRRCARIYGSQVVFSTNPCDNFTYSKKQFQFTKNTGTCIRFFEDMEPVMDHCYEMHQYKKEKP